MTTSDARAAASPSEWSLTPKSLMAALRTPTTAPSSSSASTNATPSPARSALAGADMTTSAKTTTTTTGKKSSRSRGETHSWRCSYVMNSENGVNLYGRLDVDEKRARFVAASGLFGTAYQFVMPRDQIQIVRVPTASSPYNALELHTKYRQNILCDFKDNEAVFRRCCALMKLEVLPQVQFPPTLSVFLSSPRAFFFFFFFFFLRVACLLFPPSLPRPPYPSPPPPPSPRSDPR